MAALRLLAEVGPGCRKQQHSTTDNISNLCGLVGSKVAASMPFTQSELYGPDRREDFACFNTENADVNPQLWPCFLNMIVASSDIPGTVQHIQNLTPR